MVVSNSLEGSDFAATARMLFDLVLEVKKKLQIDITLVNLGGGIGVSYRPPMSSSSSSGMTDEAACVREMRASLRKVAGLLEKVEFEEIAEANKFGCELSFEDVGEAVRKMKDEVFGPGRGENVQVVMENGRALLAPNGCLVTQVVHQKNTYRNYLCKFVFFADSQQGERKKEKRQHQSTKHHE